MELSCGCRRCPHWHLAFAECAGQLWVSPRSASGLGETSEQECTERVQTIRKCPEAIDWGNLQDSDVDFVPSGLLYYVSTIVGIAHRRDIFWMSAKVD